MSPVDDIFALVRQINDAQRSAANDWVRQRGLSTEQGLTLGFLVDNPGVIQRDIAAASGTSSASVTSLLQGLERRGLVERRTQPGDERSKRVHATPAAVELTAGFEQAMTAVRAAVLAPLGIREQDQLHRLLTTIVDQLPTRR